MSGIIYEVKKELLTANRIYYVRTDGSNSNDGLSNTSGGAFLTIQKAVDVCAALIALNTSITLTIQVASGTYTTPVTLRMPFGINTFSILGDTASPSNVVISTTNASCFYADTLGSWIIRGFKLTTTTFGHGLFALDSGAAFFCGDLDFGSIANSHMIAYRGSCIIIDRDYAISGGAQYHALCMIGGRIDCQYRAITLTGTPNFIAFAASLFSSTMIAGNNTYSGAATGQRYLADGLSLIATGGAATYFPGDAAGAVSNGGIYV